MKKAIWITWENQIRNRSMASLIGADLHVFAHKGSRLKRYLSCTYDTVKTIYSNRPDIVFAQNPSILLNYLLILIRPFCGYKLVSDAHYGGVISCQKYKYFQKVLDICNRLVDLVIVTNNDHAEYIKQIKGKALICEDPLPDIMRYSVEESNQKRVLYICSFDIDEPYINVFNAAELLHKDGFLIFVSGNYNKVNLDIEKYPFVNFLGYLPESEYYIKLFKSDIILDLTEFENCLVCGAYEAMAAEKPLVTSDTVCLRDYFNKGTVFTRHDELSIANAIKTAYQDRIKLKNEIKDWQKLIYDLQKQRLDSIYRELDWGFKRD
jgi:glycosyltransferase involved in cell wall biosynthesis